MLQILAATTNKHKIQEFQAMLNTSADSDRVCIISPDTIRGFPRSLKTANPSRRTPASRRARRHATPIWPRSPTIPGWK